MLHLIPAPLHRLVLRCAHAVRRVWWRLAKPTLRGTRVLAFDAAGRVLLIRHSYGSGHWMLPGGGIGRGEEPLAAGVRELREETACVLLNPRCFAEVEAQIYGTVHRVYMVCGEAQGTVRCDGREVIEARFCAPDALPEPLSPALQLQFPQWLILVRDPV